MPASGSPPRPSSEAVVAAARVRAAEAAGRIVADGRWSAADDARLHSGFEAAAVAALRVPAFAERSRKVRSIARAVLPVRLRPYARRLARVLDGVLGAARAALGAVRARR